MLTSASFLLENKDMTSAPQSTPIWVVLSRVFWMLFGPLILVLLLYKIVDRDGEGVASTDAIFLFVLAGLPIARWVEFRSGDPRTSTGEPATRAHMQKYVAVTLLVGAAAWIAATLLRTAS